MARAKDQLDTVAEAIPSVRGSVRGRRPHPIIPPPPPVAEDTPPPEIPRPKRHRGSRGGRRHRKAQPGEVLPPEPAPAPVEPASKAEDKPRRRRARPQSETPPPSPPSQPEDGAAVTEPQDPAKSKRRRGTRGGRKHRRKTAAVAETPAPEPEPTPEPPPPQPARRRGGAAARAQATAVVAEPAAPQPSTRRRRRRAEPESHPTPISTSQTIITPRAKIPVTGAPTEVPPPFAHNAEYEFARILDFYGINWQYEPRSFPLRWEYGHVTEAFTPDFYLPDFNLYVELTTMKPGLTAEKDRKMRLLKELYPEINVILLKKRDYLRLLAKYGYGPLSPDQIPEVSRVLIPTAKLQKRVAQLGAQISRDYAGREPVLIGVLRGVICFMADLMRHITVSCSMDLMSISSYDGNGAAAVRILKDLDENIKGKDVILVEDIVDTGMTLNHIIEYLNTKHPASVKVCALLDKRARRIVKVPLDYVGFEIPDEFVVGYGLDFRQRFRNLEFIGILKHELLP